MRYSDVIVKAIEERNFQSLCNEIDNFNLDSFQSCITFLNNSDYRLIHQKGLPLHLIERQTTRSVKTWNTLLHDVLSSLIFQYALLDLIPFNYCLLNWTK